MSIELLTVLLFGMLLTLLVLGIPLVFCFGATAVTFIYWQWGPEALYSLATTSFGEWSSFLLVAVPLFVFMANILERSGVAEELYETMYRWMGGLKGGLAMGTIVICAIFAAMSGLSAVATVTMGLIALPSMMKRKYDARLAVGSISAGGTLGILIPPSVIMIIYGSLTGTSIGKLFIAGLMPGILIAGLFISYIAIRCQIQPELGPPIPKEERYSWAEKLISLKGAISPVILIFLVLGVIYFGVCTPTEAAGIGAFGSFIVLIVNKRFTRAIIQDSLQKTIKLSAMVLWIFLGAKCFSQVYNAIGAADLLINLFADLNVNRWFILIGMQIILFIMGMFMDPGGIIMICTPVFIPVVQQLGFDPIWFGILFTINMELGYITPPFGFNLFYMKTLAQPMGIKMNTIYRSVIPFVLLEIVGLALIMIFPEIALWLVGKMM
jgi:tripartite ATP-independent transporter DctM subunit